jgi:dTDP-glucose 4,6-dehydratase
MTRLPRKLLVTGGAGFIGSTFVRRLLARETDVEVIVLDKLTYAGNLENLSEVDSDPRYRFVRGDIGDDALVNELAASVHAIVNFAAESHVDRSIEGPDAFIQTDVHGTFVLLEAARRHRHDRYLQVSTDEVYGHVPSGSSSEADPIRPRSPYSASKAAGDLLVSAYHTTYGIPAMITRASNNFGPYQYPEKLVPLFITNAIDDEPLPLYGDGQQIRDWLFVDDHCDAISLVLASGKPGEIYNIGAGNELPNLELTRSILQLLDKPSTLVRHVADRAGHDRRYSVDSSKIRSLGWAPTHSFEEALRTTVDWYRDRQQWWRRLKTDEYHAYYQRQYSDRLSASTAAD